MLFKRFSFVALLLGLMLLSSLPAGTSQSRLKRTIGGREFERGKWPWLALLKATRIPMKDHPNREFSFTCGGVLVSRQWILSAAHCFENDGRFDLGEAHKWKAWLGTVDFSVRQDLRCPDELNLSKTPFSSIVAEIICNQPQSTESSWIPRLSL
ncbi:hypothetical protein RRG08_051266 [Elysia crispata]|uniref:Peptidase S1 domain-containing protein n=1 Tax=Elysia crispata TaxID=231223 RepID=A0AAE1DTC9_9GAST|nr:hypothetical protein RRG08_051266 [Elysia crispata]